MSDRHAQILATGRYIPNRRIPNAELDAHFGEDVGSWLEERVGIRARHVMADDQNTSDLVVAAARQALERAELRPEDIDLIIVATDTPDYISPATASVVQHKLGAAGAGVFDVNAACAGWVAALNNAARHVEADDEVNHALVCGGYGMTRFLDWTDKKTATLFADGAGAVVLGAGTGAGYLAGKLVADGQYHDALGIYTGGTARPATGPVVADAGKPHVQFVRKFPSTFNAERWPPLIERTLARAGATVDEVSLFVFTQLNARTIEAVMDRLGRPMTSTHMVMDKWGYLGSACLPVAFDDALQQRDLQRGDLIVFCATGGGLTMGCSAWRWSGGVAARSAMRVPSLAPVGT
ncbi:MAG: ketoacyl-ACP synthase III [Myxococcota bacterium]